MTPSIIESQVNTALGNFLLTILGLPAANVIVGQVNRVASPEGSYCVMWPLRRPRLATNVDSWADAKFIGSIAAAIMTITEVVTGVMNVGAAVFGVGVADNTTVVNQIGGTPGGDGTYTVTPSQNIGPITLSAGGIEIEQSTEFVMQVDVHGAQSGDLVQTIATLFRDQYGVSFFAASGVTPLYCDDPRQIVFDTAASQFEERWSIDLHMEIKPVITVPQEFADAANVTVVSVTEAFPA